MNTLKTQRMMQGFRVPIIYWNFTSENVMTLDWVDGVSIRETEDLQKRNIDTKRDCL